MAAKESYMHKRMSDQVRRMGELTYGQVDQPPFQWNPTGIATAGLWCRECTIPDRHFKL